MNYVVIQVCDHNEVYRGKKEHKALKQITPGRVFGKGQTDEEAFLEAVSRMARAKECYATMDSHARTRFEHIPERSRGLCF